MSISRRNKTDSPTSGTEASPDRLHRKPFAETLAQALLLPKNSPSFVVSLEGKFGFGKTSLIRLICDVLKAKSPNERPIIFHFNPWSVSDGQNLAQDFLFQFATAFAIPDHGKDLQKVANELLRYAGVFSVAKWIPGAEPWASLVEKAYNVTGNAARSVGGLKALNVDECRSKVAKAITDIERPVVVFIDDLDRLPPADVFAMIRLVKAVSDFDRVSFLLSYDHEYVTKALAKCDVPEPARYLEKIVQWRRPIPRILPGDLLDLLNEQLNELNTDALNQRFPNDHERLSEMYFGPIRALLKNPREIHRVFNGLHFVVPATRGNVAFSDLLGLEVLAVKAPAVYDHIRQVPASYTRDTFMDFLEEKVNSQNRVKNSCDVERENRLAELPTDERTHVADLLLRLFPRSDHQTERSSSPKRSAGLVACTDVLNFYLSADVPSGEVSLPEIENFVRIPSSRKAFVAANTTREKIRSSFEIIYEICGQESPPEIEDFCQKLCEISEQPAAVGWLNGGIIKSDTFSFLKSIILSQLRRLERPKRSALLIRLCSNPRMLPITQPVIEVLSAESDEPSKTHGNSPFKRNLLTRTAKRSVVSTWTKTAICTFETEAGWRSNVRKRVFLTLAKIKPSAARKLALQQFKSDHQFDQLLRTILSHTSISGDEVANIGAEELEPFGGIVRYKRRGTERLNSQINVPDDIAIIIRSIHTGKAYYLKNGRAASI